MRKESFFIFGHYGWQNTGDDAMIYVLLRELHIIYPNATFTLLAREQVTIPPELSGSVKLVAELPRIVSLLKIILLEIPKSSVVILGGGTHILDYHGSLRFLWPLLQVLSFLLFAKILRKRVYLLGIGIEPVSTFWGKFLTQQICRLADFINVRDKLSHEFLKELKLGNKVNLGFDISVLLQPPSISEAKSERVKNQEILGVSILPFFKIYEADSNRDALIIHELVTGLSQWLERNPLGVIHLFIFKGRSKDDDVRITNMLQTKIQPQERVQIIPYNPNPNITLSEVALCDAFIGMRLHSCVFAYASHIPLLVINYLTKCQSLASDIGIPKQAVISIEEILGGQFGKYLENLQHHPECFSASLPLDTARQKAKDSLIWFEKRFPYSQTKVT